MNTKPTILAICGSTRTASSNHLLIEAFAQLNKETMSVTFFEGLTHLPHFNPDDDGQNTPATVTAFRERLTASDAVLICTPEYAIGVPGTLKNAIDWTVSSMNFSRKPVALITASLSGAKAHQSLLGTLLIIESRMTEATQVLIPFIKTKISADAQITDQATLEAVKRLSLALLELMSNKDDHLLSAPLLMNDGVNSGGN